MRKDKEYWLAKGRAQAFRWLAEEFAACELLHDVADLLTWLAETEEEITEEDNATQGKKRVGQANERV